jgi:MFS transporter, ACS family, tartrate transporter
VAPLILYPQTAEFAAQTRRKIARRLVPFVSFLYVIAYLDRVNLSYASLEMTKELHFSNQVYGLGAGLFFISYALLEIPGTVMVDRWSARKWISRIMVTWGVAAAFTGLIHTQGQFYGARVLLGAAEAGFAPGVMVYLSHWFRAKDRARALGGFYAAIPIAQFTGSAFSAVLSNVHWLGWNGWRWILILEGVPAIIAGVWVFFYLTDRPREARWLTAEERDWITNELEQEKKGLSERQGTGGWRAVFQPQVALLTAVWFLSLCTTNGLSLWLPKILQRMSGYGPVAIIVLSGVPYLAAWPFTLLVGWNSDRTVERRWHTTGCLLLASAGLALSQATNNISLGLLGLTFAAMGLNARQPPFWAISTSMLAGTASAVTVGMINSIGQLGGFFGPSIVGFLVNRTGTYTAGTYYLVGCAIAAASLMLLWKPSSKLVSSDHPLSAQDLASAPE